MKPVLSILSDGAHKLYSVNTDKFKFSSLTVLLSVPDEIRNAPALNLLLAVMSRGTVRHCTVGEINRYLDNLYSMNISTRRIALYGKCYIGVTCELIDGKYTLNSEDLEEKAVDFIGEMLFSPLFNDNGRFLDEYVESEKADILNSLAAIRNNTAGYASMRCREMLCKDDETDNFTYEELISGTAELDSATLTDYYKKTVVDCSIVAFYVGCREEKIKNALEKMISECKIHPKHKKLSEVSSPVRYRMPDEVLKSSECFPVSQCKLSMGFRTDIVMSEAEDDMYAMEVLCEIFGGGQYSKLFSNLREKMGMCYYCSAAYSKPKGIIMVNSGVDISCIKEMEKEIMSQLESVLKGDFTDNELTAAKLSLRFAYSQITDSTASVENYFLPRVLTMRPDSFGVSYDIAKIMAVTREDILKVGKRIWQGAVFTVIGDGKPEENVNAEQTEN